MNTLEFLSKLRDLGIQISTDGDKLRCNAPKDVLTPQLRSELAERKEEIIELLKNNNLSDNTSSSSGIQPVSREQILPLSFAQQRLWFIDQLVTGKGLYHIPRAVRLTGTLDTLALRKALNHMVRRHEILRTLIIRRMQQIR